MKKILFLFFVIFHFSVIIYNNIKIEAKAISKHVFKETDENNVVERPSNNIIHKVVSFYSKYTGTETGYGFYGPNVSSQVVLVVTKIDEQGRTISIDLPRLISHDANIRLCNAMDLFLNKIDNYDTTYDKYMNLVLKSMALWTMNTDIRCKKIIADLLIYDVRTNSYRSAKISPKYLKLGHYEFSTKEYVAKN